MSRSESSKRVPQRRASLPSEFDLIRRICSNLPTYNSDVLVGSGDDAAVILPTEDMATLLTTDTFVEGVDFDLAFSSWRQIGWKCMAANFSDVAAMGGIPRHALIALCLPVHRRVDEVAALYEGFRALIDHSNHAELLGDIVGGDLSATDGPTIITITLTGESKPQQCMRRSGAMVGDQLCVTGNLGASEAGLQLLSRARKQISWEKELSRFPKVLAKHREPLPRVREGRLLAGSGWVRAMIDVSDGLSSDALHLCRESHVGLVINAMSLPVEKETRRALESLRLDLAGTVFKSGEEFELLCAVDPARVEALAALLHETTGSTLTPIGEFVHRNRGYTWNDGLGVHALQPEGYVHFQP